MNSEPQNLSSDQVFSFEKYVFVLMSGNDRMKFAGYTDANYRKIYRYSRSARNIWSHQFGRWPAAANVPSDRDTHDYLGVSVGRDLMRKLMGVSSVLFDNDTADRIFAYSDALSRDLWEKSELEGLGFDDRCLNLHFSSPQYCHFLISNGKFITFCIASEISFFRVFCISR